jgi:ATP-binding cassette, subfamily B, bacterial MsbA
MIWIRRLNEYGVSNGVILLLFGLSLFAMAAQIVGLGIFLPIFEYIFQSGLTQSVDESQSILLNFINIIINTIGLKTSLESLLISAFLFYLVSQVAVFVIAYINAYYLGKIIKTVRDRFIQYYLDADSEYYDRVKIGDFINISTSELEWAAIGVIAPIKLMVSIVSAFGSIIVLLLLSYELTFYISIIVIIILPYPLSLISKTTKVGKQNTEFNSSLVSFLLDRLRSPRLVRLSGTRNSEVKEYSLITEKQRGLTLKLHLLKEKVGLTFEPAIIFAALIVLYVALTFLGMQSSSIILFMVITVRLVPILRAILVQKQSINRTRGPIESIDSLLKEMKLETQKEIVSNQKNESSIEVNSIGNIKLKDVSYSYSNEGLSAISNISLVFNKGTINAIIGPSGSGKSTLIDIISTYRKPNNGQVLFDNFAFNSTQINKLIAYVPQQPQIFDGEILEHISYGNKNQSIENIEAAAKLSGIHQFILSLENGYESILNNNGDNLSGGQRYRLDMARALLSEAPILILDEPTSALDYENKGNFIITLNQIRNETNKIIIVITHDFSIMSIFDSIVLLEKGEMIAQSSHTELVIKSRWYREGTKNIKEVSFDN